MANGSSMKSERLSHVDISYKIEPWKSSSPIEVIDLEQENFFMKSFVFSASVMFAFPDRQIVKKVVNHLPRVGVGGRYGLPQQR